MKVCRYIQWILLSLLLVGCTRIPSEQGTTSTPTAAVSPTGTSTETPTPSPETGGETILTPSPTEEPVDMYAPRVDSKGYSPEEVVEYFGDVALQTEFAGSSNNSNLLRRWGDPIRCYIYGEPTSEDLLLIDALFAELNNIPGFVGIHIADDSDEANVRIHFATGEEYDDLATQYVSGASDGFATCWYYTDSNRYYEAEVGICMDVTQTTRNSVILEELVQMLGLLNDSYLYEDSIFYQSFNEPQWPSDLDWIMVQLLYHPLIEPGMTYEDCAELIPDILYETEADAS